MKTAPVLIKVLLASSLLVGITLGLSKNNSDEELLKKTEIMTESVLRHVVLFKFNDGVAAEVITNIEKEFAALPGKIPIIQDFEWGMNSSPEGLDKGLTHCYFLTFKTEADRDAYLPNKDHQAFVKLLDGIVADVVVVDYWTK